MTKEEAKHFSNVLKAYSEGKSIEMMLNNGNWVDFDGHNFIAHPSYYRIKPESKYRPYKNAKEFLQAQKEHGPYIRRTFWSSWDYEIPRKVYDFKVIWEPFQGKEVRSTWEELSHYTWQDGTPCGVLKN